MSDIRTTLFRSLTPGVAPTFDYALTGNDLASDDGLTTAVIISLFTDRRADADDALPDPHDDDRRGWWADAWPSVDQDLIGSRLWLLSREKQMADVVARARDYLEEALAWFVESGVASQVDVMTGWVDRVSRAVTEARDANSMPGVLGIAITIYRPDESPARFQFELVWEGQHAV